jgi:hypothetical protein
VCSYCNCFDLVEIEQQLLSHIPHPHLQTSPKGKSHILLKKRKIHFIQTTRMSCNKYWASSKQINHLFSKYPVIEKQRKQ